MSSVLRVTRLEGCGLGEVKVHQEGALLQRKLFQQQKVENHYYRKDPINVNYNCASTIGVTILCTRLLTYRDGSSLFKSFIWSGMTDVELSCLRYSPLNSNCRNLRLHLNSDIHSFSFYSFRLTIWLSSGNYAMSKECGSVRVSKECIYIAQNKERLHWMCFFLQWSIVSSIVENKDLTRC